MSSTNTTTAQSPASQAQVPAERVFQIDPSGLGGIAQSVNLFRGDVSVPINVISLTSRSGVDASLALIYNSNIGEQVDTWNLDAPTGPLGLGWSLGYEFIARDPQLAAKPIDGVCYLVAGGSANRLFRTAMTPDYWEYEAENYLFWRIRYFPQSEQWELVQEDGTRRLYGGSGAGENDGAVQFGIKWVGADGNWSDATVITSGQSRYAVGWNLSTIATAWGESVQMEYENSLATIGGSAGLGYTVSSRLKRVMVPMVRSLVFNYLPKRDDEQAREYQVPHFAPNTPTLHAYQDRYDTHFLDSVEVRNADDAASAPGALVQHVGFEYTLANMSLGHQGNADYVKRYLVAVNYTTPEGLPMPDMRFEYVNDPSKELGPEFHRGALKSILYPQGGRITYAYQHTHLAGTDRAATLTSRGTPRVWFGSDYAVLVHYESVQSGLTVRILSWNGQWVEAPATYNLSREIDLATLEVSVQPEFFALACRTAGARPDFLVLLFHKQKGRYGQWITEQNFATLPLQNGDQALLATGTDFAVALSSGPHLLAKVWDERAGRWADESAGFAIPSNASYALAASADYVALAAADTSAHRAQLQIWYRVRQGTGFDAARLDSSTLTNVDWQPDSTPQAFWSLGNCFASMTYVNGGDDRTIRYTVKVLQWDDSFRVRTVLDRALSTDAGTKLPYAQSVVSGSVLGNVSHLFRYDGQAWQEGSLPLLEGNGDSPPRFVYGNDLAVVSGKASSAIASFNPYQPKWEAAVQIPISQAGMAPTASGNYVSVDRQVFYRDPSGALNPVHVLDSNLVPQSLVNRAPYFIAYEDQSGNTHVLPLSNGQVDAAAEIVLANERIHVPDGGNGTTLVGRSSLMTYRGGFDSPSELRLYQFVQKGVEGPVACYPVQSLSIDDGYPDDWGGVWEAASKCSRFYYDCDNVTVTPDGQVHEFAAATTVYGARGEGQGVAYPVPADTPFGRSEYRYHNNRSPRASGLVPDDAMLDPSVSYYSFLNGMLFDQTDYDAAGVPVERTYNIYEVRTEVAPIDAAALRLPVIGGYVKKPRTEISQYEQAIDVVLPQKSAGLAAAHGTGAPQGVPADLAQALSARSVAIHPEATLVPVRSPGHWRLYPDPSQPLFLPVTIHGTRATASVAVTRGVGSEFSWQTGLVFADYTENYNSHGKHETVRREVYRAWQIPAYSDLAATHNWAAVAVSIRFWAEEGMAAPGQPQAISVNTLARWPGGAGGAAGPWAPRRNFIAASAEAYDPALPIPVRFDAWDNAMQPSSDTWRLSGEILARDPGGSTLEAVDAFGKPTATVLNRQGTGRVAEFSNATLAEALYAGFETYEDLARWSLGGQPVQGTGLVRGDAHTGMCSLRVPADPSKVLSTPLSLYGGRAYILSCWVKTALGFDDSSAKARWSVVSGGQALGTFDIAGSGGRWAYRHWSIVLEGAGDATAVELQLCNGKSSPADELLLDDVMLAPLESGASASVYDEVSGAEIAGVGLNGSTVQSFFDSRQRAAVQTDATGDVVGSSITYLVRENDAHPDFRFSPGDPNAVVQVQSPQGGVVAGLVQGEGWRSQWEIPRSGAWDVQGGVLLHVGSGTDEIAFVPSRDLADYAMRVSLRLPVDTEGKPILPSQPIGLDIGTVLGVRWSPADGWSLTLDGVRHALAAPDFVNDWALLAPVDPVSGTSSVHFYAGGKLLFAQVGSSEVRGMARLVVGDAGIGFSSIALLRAPMLSAVFLDGSGKERQQQAFAGEGSIVSGSVYDPIGRAALGVKPVAVSGRALAYDEDYVRSFDPTSGIMAGRAASAYPDDEGYPYVRTEFFRTAQSLAARQGAPGKPLAIAYTGSAQAHAELNAHVQQFSYGTNVKGQFGGDAWPSNQYFVKKIIDPNGDPSYTLTSQIDEVLATVSSPGEGQMVISQYFYDGSGRLVKSMPPAGVDAQRAGDPDADQWASTTSYNFLGEGIESHDPNSGVLRSVFGPDSQVRFLAGADEEDGMATIRYVKYDGIGRDIEAGTVRRVWDRAELQRIALREPGWPGAAENPRVNRSYLYDGDGSDPAQWGRLVRCTEFGAVPGEHVEQSFTYGTAGQLLAQTQTATAFDAQQRTVRYGYDALGRVVGVEYPQESEIPQIRYAYNRLGQIFQIGTQEDPAAFARFSYTATGQVDNSAVRLSAALELLSQAQYGPPGWLTSNTTTAADATVMQERLSYTEGGYQGAGYFDGKIASAKISDAGGTAALEYAYDGLSRLRMAQRRDGGAQGSVDTALTYDANGNIATLDTGGTQSSYTYLAHSDQVEKVESGGTTVDTYRYNGQGAAVSARRRGLADIAYNPATGMADAITLDDGSTVGFGYDARQARTVKKFTSGAGAELGARQYLRDPSGSPLLELSRSASSADGKVQYLYGPSGLMGMHAHGKRYAVVRDHLGSVRKVVDETGAVVAQYDYTSFGVTATRAGSTQPDILYYRYTGQELDPETGLYNYQARFYDPELGRFVAVDPKRQGSSPYVYVLNNPIGLVDPDGEEALTAFLIAVIVSAIIGAVVGAVTYAVTHQGNFDVGKFFLYAAAGLVAGAAGGATAFGGGLMATAALGAVGVSTSTSIGSGIVVGAVAGAVDGAVAGTVNQVGVNLIERRPIGEGVGQAAWMGAAIGGAAGAVLGGITGAVNYRTANRVRQPTEVISDRPSGQTYATLKGAQLSSSSNIQTVAARTGNADVVGFVAHGSSNATTLRFTDNAVVGVGPGLLRKDVSHVIADLQAGNFGGGGIDLSRVCSAGNSGVARSLARDLRVPVRAATGSTTFPNVAATYFGRSIPAGEGFIRISRSLQGVAFRTYYPSQLRTGWNYLFGY